MNPKPSKQETEELPLAKATEMLLSESRMVYAAHTWALHFVYPLVVCAASF